MRVLLLFLAAAALLLMLSDGIRVAESQTSPVLVSNLAESTETTASLGVGSSGGTRSSQGFGTGGNEGGYLLTGVTVEVKTNLFTGSQSATFKIYDSNTNGTARNELYTLTTPTLTAGSTAFFAAPSGAKLDPNENYHVVFQGTAVIGIALELLITNSDTETGETGWTIENASRSRGTLNSFGDSVKMSIHGVANNAATGDPTISGDATVGHTLTADTTAIMDADGLSNVSYSYQWIRVDANGTSNPTPISGATDSTYTLTEEDVGKKVRVRVSFTDDNSVPEERTSNAHPSTGTVAFEDLTAQFDPVLVTNMSTSKLGSRVRAGLSQAFTTGSNSAGYTLTQIQMESIDAEGDDFTIQVCGVDNNDHPTSSCTLLTRPDSFARGRLTFTPPGGLHLNADATYAVVFRRLGSAQTHISVTDQTTDDTRSLNDWSLRDSMHWNNSGTWQETGETRVIRLSLRGEANAQGATLISTIAQAEASGFTTESDVAQRFTTGFNPGGYSLTSVDLRLNTRNDATTTPTVTIHSHTPTGPTVATLTGPAALGENTVNNYTFAAPNGATLAPSTVHWLRIQSGNDVRIKNVTGTPTLNTATDGWNIGNMVNVDDLTATGIQSRLLKFRVRGKAAPPPILLGNDDGAPPSTLPGDFDAADYGQTFRTGSGGGSFKLYSVDLWLDISGDESFPTVTLLGGFAGGATVATLIPPTERPSGDAAYRYRLPSPVTLNADQWYTVVASGSSSASWRMVAQGNPDSGSLPGWRFYGTGHTVATPSWTEITLQQFQMRLHGVPSTPPHLVSNLDQSLSTGQFNLGTSNEVAKRFLTGGNPGGYTLTGVTVTLGEVSGITNVIPTLTLHSGSATGTQVATFTGPAGIRGGDNDYTYAPTTTVTLSASTEYWLVLQGGSSTVRWKQVNTSDEDAGGAPGWSINTGSAWRAAGTSGAFTSSNNTMAVAINGTIVPPTNSAATGMPRITVGNVYRVPAVLTANILDIGDANGVRGIAHTATYRWQRFASDGTTLERDNIGTGPTYTLRNADVGKRLKVVVRFVDDAGNAEGPLTSGATTPAVTAEATCAAPTLAGDFELIGGPRTVSLGPVPGANGFNASSGHLNYPQFTTAARQTYEIVSALIGSGAFVVTFDQSIYDVDRPRLALHVCDDGPYSLSALSGSPILTVTGSSVPDAWSGHAVRRIYVSEDSTGPMFADASVNGASLVVTFHEPLGAAASLANSAFTVKKGSGGTTQTLTGTPSISGSTVTLTLSTAVTASDTDVTVAYTKPSSGTANKVVDTRGNEAGTFGDTGARNLLADSIAPTLHTMTSPVLAADGKTLTITLSEAMKETSVPVNSAFTVKATPAGSSEATVALATSNGVTVSGSTVVLKLDPGIAHNDTAVKVSYAKPGSGASLQDIAGNDLADFTDTAVTNNSTIPRVSVEAVHADASSGIASPEFRFTRSLVTSSPLTIFSTTTEADTYLLSTPDEIAIEGDAASEVFEGQLLYGGNTSGDLTVTLAAGSGYLPAPAPNNSATVSVKAPATGKPINVVFPNAEVRVNEGDTATVAVDVNLAAGLAEPRESYTITFAMVDEEANITEDYVRPGLMREIDVEITPTDWQNAMGGGKTYRINQQITTIEDAEVEANETFHMEVDVSGLDAEILGLPEIETPGHRSTVIILDDDPLVVSSVAVTSSATNSYYTAGDDITFEVTFTGYVSVDTEDGTPQLAFDIGGRTRMATAAATEDEMEATFTYTVLATDVDDHDGISWGADAITLNGGSITIVAKESPVPRNANLAHVAQSALPGHKVDTSKPTLVSATVSGTTLTLEFSEDLNTTAPAITAFSGKKTPSGSSEVALTIAGVAPTISGRTVTLTLATTSSVTATDTDVKVSYTKPSNNPIQDPRGNQADSFSDKGVGNALADSVPPTLDGNTAPVLAADGKTLTITFNEAMKTTSVPANSAFTVKATPMGGSEATVALATSNGVTVSGSTVVLKLDPGIAHNDTDVKVSYTKPGSDPVLEDANGNDLASFPEQAVTNNSTIPRVSISTMDTDWTPALAHADFVFTRSNTANATLEVNYEITGAFTADGTWEFEPNETSAFRLRQPHSGNAPGAVTFTVVAGDGYLPALSPNNAATVDLKVPTSGRYVTISHRSTSYTVTEDANVTYDVNFVAHAGVAQPRDNIEVIVSSRNGTAQSGDDFVPVSETITVQPGDWSASGQGWTASKTFTVQTHDDNEYEGNETFTLIFQNPPVRTPRSPGRRTPT